MVQPSLRAWLGTSVLGGLLVAGCQHAQHRQATMSVPQTVTSVTVLPGPAPLAMMPQAPAPQPVVVQETAPAPVAVEPVVVAHEVAPPPPPAPPIQAETLPVSYIPPPIVGTKPEGVQRRSYADITAKPCFGHAADYTWLTGELELIHPNNVWHLRYASVQDDDRYGGGVTLTETGPMDRFSCGQCVRVEGRMVDPDSRACSPEFRVLSITPLPNP
ncbi:MAG TPA: hypothetical protein VG013_21695 [Gemmataceae bacterium]|nr:hypothetical protein [Gemmataceae bacterium]